MAMEPILYETPSHTPLCRHAVGNPTEYAAVARERGLKGLLVTCHNPMPDGFSSSVRMAEAEFEEYLALVESAREDCAGEIEVFGQGGSHGTNTRRKTSRSRPSPLR